MTATSVTSADLNASLRSASSAAAPVTCTLNPSPPLATARMSLTTSLTTCCLSADVCTTVNAVVPSSDTCPCAPGPNGWIGGSTCSTFATACASEAIRARSASVSPAGRLYTITTLLTGWPAKRSLMTSLACVAFASAGSQLAIRSSVTFDSVPDSGPKIATSTTQKPTTAHFDRRPLESLAILRITALPRTRAAPRGRCASAAPRDTRRISRRRQRPLCWRHGGDAEKLGILIKRNSIRERGATLTAPPSQGQARGANGGGGRTPSRRLAGTSAWACEGVSRATGVQVTRKLAAGTHTR